MLPSSKQETSQKPQKNDAIKQFMALAKVLKAKSG